MLDFLAKRAETLDVSHCSLKREQVHPLISLVENSKTLVGFWADGQLTDVEERRVVRALLRNIRASGGAGHADAACAAAESQPSARAPPNVISVDELF